MPQMYTIFINDLSLHIAEKAPSLVNFSEVEALNDFEKWFLTLENSVDTNHWLLTNDPKTTFESFASQFVHVEAAGGLVYNPKGQLLVIHRLGKWDLPKGKIEQGEGIEEAAVREVEEECGISDLTIESGLPSTFHTYTLKGRRILKKTHWFVMKTKSLSLPVPQLEEDILEAKWINRSQVDEVLKNTYPSILFLLNTHLIGDK